MNTGEFKSKLTTVFSVDVAGGYSPLMQDDEEATLRTITAYREVMSNLMLLNYGRVLICRGRQGLEMCKFSPQVGKELPRFL